MPVKRGNITTLRQICDALAAYTVRPLSLDRAEVWRRADANVGPSVGALTIEETADCFIACPSRPAAGERRSLLLIDRRTGALTRWPDLPTEKLIGHYRRYLRGEL